MILNLEKVWQVCEKLSEKEEELFEQGVYVALMGSRSEYSPSMRFENFLNYYNFKIEEDIIIVYNDGPATFEDWSHNDYSEFPLNLLDFDEEQLNEWVETKVSDEIRRQETKKEDKKQRIQLEIEQLKKELAEIGGEIKN